jgi:hypothetical protein
MKPWEIIVTIEGNKILSSLHLSLLSLLSPVLWIPNEQNCVVLFKIGDMMYATGEDVQNLLNIHWTSNSFVIASEII